MFNILKAIKNNLALESPIISQSKSFSHNPSRAMCYSEIDQKPVGACIRSVYLSTKKYPTSNPTTPYIQMTAEAGKLWEQWLINQYKEIGIYISHSTKLFDAGNNMSGEFDIVHYNPDTGDVELSECKQYNGSNYYAKQSIVGSFDKAPAPKDPHLLQCVDYLLMCQKTGNNVSHVNLVYIDRSCGSFENNIQFLIELIKDGDKQFPSISYFDENENVLSYIDRRISDKALYAKNNVLDKFFELELLPPRDYELSYSKEYIEQLVFQKKVSARKYSDYKKDPITNPIGDFQCGYCPYGPDEEGFSTCWSMSE